MADFKISFSQNNDKILSFLNSQNIDLSPELYDELLAFLSKACTYEEEERKIRPSVVIGHNLLDDHSKSITQATTITFAEEPINDAHLNKRLKSFLPFCNNGWRVFINIDKSYITWGIVRNFNGPSGLDYAEILTSMTKEDIDNLNTDFVLIDVISNYEIKLSGNNNSCIIDFRLTQDSEDRNNPQSLFCQDLLSGYATDIIKTHKAYSKIVDLFSQKLHGSICLIIKHDYSLPDKILKDGVFLNEPIDIYSVLDNELNGDNPVHDINAIINSHQKFHALSGILLEMMNIDGITIVDNKGRIRAFNVFVRPESANNVTLSGGARKRAANFLKHQTNCNYIGVYFQSQDGMSSYERIDNNE